LQKCESVVSRTFIYYFLNPETTTPSYNQMNKTLLVLVIVLKSLFVFSQEITLTGKVYHYAVGIKEERKIYFTFDETPFSEQHFLKYTENYEYEWKISLNQLKKDSIKSVYFSIDANSNHLERDNCVQEIKLDSLLANDPYLKKKNSSIVHWFNSSFIVFLKLEEFPNTNSFFIKTLL
jgi:hypothetical protein